MTWANFQGTFPTSVPLYGNYNVTVLSQTPNITCLSVAPSGTAMGANVTVYFSCRTTTPITLSTNQNAARVIGQPNFTSHTSGTSASVLAGPTDYLVLSPNNVLYLSDKLNNRILGFNPSPIVSSPSATFAVGQPDLVSGTANNGGNANAFSSTQGSASDGNVYAVVDRVNNRVLLWNTFPPGDRNADIVVGQTTMAGNSTGCSQNGLDGPYEAIFGGSALLIADSSNSRILIWNQAPTSNGANANLVIGQTSFTNCTAGTTSSVINNPYGVWSDGNRILVADTFNNRIMVWNTFPTVNGQFADGILGQSSATVKGTACSDHNFHTPYTVTSDGVHIFVSDGANYRIAVFNGFPSTYSTGTIVAAVGQTSLTTCSQNNGNGANCRINSMSLPSGLTVIGTSLYLSDLQNSRVLVFDSQ